MVEMHNQGHKSRHRCRLGIAANRRGASCATGWRREEAGSEFSSDQPTTPEKTSAYCTCLMCGREVRLDTPATVGAVGARDRVRRPMMFRVTLGVGGL